MPAPSATSSGPDLCPICLSELQRRGGRAIVEAGCGHRTHYNCLQDLLRSNRRATCPMCRQPLGLDASALSPAAAAPPARAPAPPPIPSPAPPRPAVAPPTIDLVPEFATVAASSPARVSVLATVRAPLAANTPTRPIDLVVVLDRSSSMQGRRMERAKDALRYAISEELSQDGDRLAIVAFDRAARVLLPLTRLSDDAGTVRAYAAMDALRTGRGTEIADGLRLGLEVVRPTGNATASAIVLLSDGEDRISGETVAELKAISASLFVPVFTFGVGDEHDAGLLSSLASSGGVYTFIHSADMIRGALAGVAGAVRGRMYVDCTLRLKVPAEAGRDAEITRIWSGYPTARASPREVSVGLPDLYRGEQRDVVVEISLPAGAAGRLPILAVEFEHSAPDASGTTVVASFPLSISRDDSAPAGAAADPAVALQKLRIDAAEAIRAASLPFSDRAASHSALRDLERAILALPPGPLRDPLLEDVRACLRSLREQGRRSAAVSTMTADALAGQRTVTGDARTASARNFMSPSARVAWERTTEGDPRGGSPRNR
ncbi:hypothetical protein DFJ74DRAFT_705559 [Hyaloraphidium curvatum]|nr:hypothetical protein DFJ74DRAFT_705559 [Hyaloraphidium curvatum]